MLLKEFVLSSREQLSSLYPAEEANAITGILCTEFLGVQSYTYMVNPAYLLKDKDVARAQAALGRLLESEPLQYVLGHAGFYGQDYRVTPAVLIPRPETEEVCRVAIQRALMLCRERSAYGQNAKAVRILDLCTGSGCIAWTMAVNVPGSRVVAVDISADALEVASTQKIDLPKDRKPVFVQADVLDAESLDAALAGQEAFDMIISNPPYVLDSEKALMRRNVLDYEPHLALFVPDDDAMKFNLRLAAAAGQYLCEGGTGYIEINENLGPQTAAVMEQSGLKKVEIITDLYKKQRFVTFTK